MRALVEFSVLASDERAGDDAVAGIDAVVLSLADFGWTTADLDVERSELVAMARDVALAANKAGRDLPISPHSQFVQSVIDRDGGDRFARFSFERHCLEQTLLILTQVPEIDHGEVYTREMVTVVGPEFGVYGLILHRAQPRRGGSEHYIVHLRSRDLERLQKATGAFVSALGPIRTHGTGPARVTPARAARRRRAGPAGFRSVVSRLELRSEADELLFTAGVVPIGGRLALVRHSFANLPALLLTTLSVVLTAASALLFWFGGDTGWWSWAEELTGRLATGAFGALLVDGVTVYGTLRRSLAASAGPATNGALLDWDRAGA